MDKANLLNDFTMQAEGFSLVPPMDHTKMWPIGSEDVPFGAEIVDFLDDMRESFSTVHRSPVCHGAHHRVFRTALHKGLAVCRPSPVDSRIAWPRHSEPPCTPSTRRSPWQPKRQHRHLAALKCRAPLAFRD